MTQPVPGRDEPALRGPYGTSNGYCAAGHPLNGLGRCDPLNSGLEQSGPTPTLTGPPPWLSRSSAEAGFSPPLSE